MGRLGHCGEPLPVPLRLRAHHEDDHSRREEILRQGERGVVLERFRLLHRQLGSHRLPGEHLRRQWHQKSWRIRHCVPHDPPYADPANLPHRQVPEAALHARLRVRARSGGGVLGHLPDDVCALRLLDHPGANHRRPEPGRPAPRLPPPEVRQTRDGHAHLVRDHVLAHALGLRGNHAGPPGFLHLPCRLHHLRELWHDRPADGRDQRKHVRKEQRQNGGGQNGEGGHAEVPDPDVRGVVRPGLLEKRPVRQARSRHRAAAEGRAPLRAGRYGPANRRPRAHHGRHGLEAERHHRTE
mmetsp:Transcript_45491/g.134650  ORF Transcript_45491/g.134650 Transcript_45491/m.134650 type:complete len:297 (-) Transcript_45491:462-1352(-)